MIRPRRPAAAVSPPGTGRWGAGRAAYPSSFGVQTAGFATLSGHRSSIAQLAEQPAVNRQVLGSSPSGGANAGIGPWGRSRSRFRPIRYAARARCGMIAAMQWLAVGEAAIPDGVEWLSAAEAARGATMRFTKRRTEYRLRRLAGNYPSGFHAGGSGSGYNLGGGCIARHWRWRLVSCGRRDDICGGAGDGLVFCVICWDNARQFCAGCFVFGGGLS